VTAPTEPLRPIAHPADRRHGPRTVSSLLVGGLVFSLLYYGYRYPFRWNVAGLNPTYTGTPALVSVSKYVVILGLLGVIVGMGIASGRSLVVTRSAGILLLTSGALVVLAPLAGGQAFKLMTALIFSLVSAAMVSLAVNSFPVAGRRLWRAGGRIIAAFVVGNAVANLIQIALYAATGRVPFNGYAGILVRFGGIWDDPNQEAMFCALVFVAWLEIDLRTGRRPRRLLQAAALFNILISVSYSGYVGVIVGSALVLLHSRALNPHARRRPLIRRRRGIPIPLLALAFAFAVLVVLHPDTSAVNRAVGGKSDSAKARLSIIVPADFTKSTLVPNPAQTPRTIVRTALRGDGRITSETSYVRLALGGGLLPIALLAAWLFDTVPLAHRFVPWAWPVVVALLAGSFFVPDLLVFPMALLFFGGAEVAAAMARTGSHPPGSPLAVGA